VIDFGFTPYQDSWTLQEVELWNRHFKVVQDNYQVDPLLSGGLNGSDTLLQTLTLLKTNQHIVRQRWAYELKHRPCPN
jgi:hypothetical protein